MAKSPYGKGNVTAARQFLANIPSLKFDKPVGKLSDKYVVRQANAINRQFAAGLQANRQAARGHITTPEHGKGTTAPKVAAEFRKGRAIGVTPNVQRGVRTLGNGTRQYVGGRTFAREAIKDAAAQDKRVTARVFNARTGRWQEAYPNIGHTPGISAKYLEERAKAAGRTVPEQIAYDSLGGGDSAGGMPIEEEDLETLEDILSALVRGEVPQEPSIDLGDYTLWEVNVV